MKNFDQNFSIIAGYESKYYYYWEKLGPIPKWINGIIMIYTTFLMTFGCFGNVLTIGLFITTKTLRSPTNLLLCNLAFSDLMILVSNCPMHLIAHLCEKWPFGLMGCDIYGFSGAIFGLGSINIIAIITLDRAYSILNAMEGKKISYKLAISALAFVWIYCGAWSLFPIFGWNNYAFEGGLSSCTIDYLSQDKSSRAYVWNLFVFCFIVPFSIICVTYGTIFYVITKNRVRLELQSAKLKGERFNKFIQTYRWNVKLAKMVFIILIGFLVAWLPYTVVVLLCVAGKARLVTPVASITAAIYAKTSAMYNPYIYFITHDKIKKVICEKLVNMIGYETQYAETNSINNNTAVDTMGSFKSQSSINNQSRRFRRQIQNGHSSCKQKRIRSVKSIKKCTTTSF